MDSWTELSILSADRGETMLHLAFPEGMKIAGAHDGIVYVHSAFGELHAIQAQSQLSTGTGGNPMDPSPKKAVRGTLVVSTDPAEARVYVDGKAIGAGTVVCKAIPLGHHDVRVELGGYRPISEHVVLESVDPVALSVTLRSSIWEEWSVAIEDSRYDQKAGVRLKVYDATVMRSTGPGFSAYDAGDGQILWQIRESPSLEPIIANGILFWASQRSVSAAFSASGNVIWTRELPEPITWTETEGSLLIVADAAGEITAFSGALGSPVWQIADVCEKTEPALSAGTIVYLGADGFLKAADTGSGRIKWQRRTDGTPALLAAYDGSAYSFDRTNDRLSMFDMNTGTVTSCADGVDPLPVFGSSYLCYAQNPSSGSARHDSVQVVPIGSEFCTSLHFPRLMYSPTQDRVHIYANSMYVASPGRITAFDLREPGERWTCETRATDQDSVCVEELGGILFIGHDQSLVALDALSGTLVWESILGSPLDAMTTGDASLFVATRSEIMKLAIDERT